MMRLPQWEVFGKTSIIYEWGLYKCCCTIVNYVFYHAGLCRTCEIFGVSQLVLNSMNITEDSQFQALSVSAEKWVPITQVFCSNIF